MELSEEERKRRSENAKALHAKGKFGGNQRGAGRPRVKRATEKIAEEADQNAAMMIKELKQIIKNGSNNEKLKAIDLWLGINMKETDKKEKREQAEIANASREDLIKMIGPKIQQLIDSGLDLSKMLPETIEGTAIDITDE